MDNYGNPDTFVLKRDTSAGMTSSHSQQEDYLIEEYSQSGWDKTFDYNSSTDTFTIYDGQGPSEELHFLGDDQLEVEALLPENSDTSGIYEADGAGIYRYGSHAISHYITDAMAYFLESGEGVTFSSIVPGDGSWRNFSVRRNTQQTSASSEPRYILINANNSYEWVAFTYDASNRVFTMYDASSGDEPYAYCRFREDDALENRAMNGMWLSTGIYVKQADGSSYANIAKYITDGMLLFLDNID